jgi:outer membrane protein assembly factor BamD
MKVFFSVFLAVFYLLTTLCSSSQAVWIWDPKTGKWSNPKYEVKGSSKNQLRHAESFEEKGEWERAAKEYKRLVKAYPTSPLAPEALARSAQCFEKANYYYEAYKAYQMIIEKYPSYSNIQQVVKEQYRIGNLFLSGKKKKMKIIKLAIFSSMEIAAEIFRKIVENFPYGELADKSQLRLGKAYEKMKKYPEAIAEYKKFLKEYSKSELADEAKYRMGYCAYKQSKGSAYDQDATEKALEIFNEFLRDFPQSKRAEEVKMLVHKLNGRKAKGLFEIAAYYDKVKEKKSAKVYYEQVIQKYPESEEAKVAKHRLESLNTGAENAKTSK